VFDLAGNPFNGGDEGTPIQPSHVVENHYRTSAETAASRAAA